MVEPALRFCSPHATICAFAYLCAPMTGNVPPEEPPTIPPGYHRFRSCAHRVPGYNGNRPVAANKRIGKTHRATSDICNVVECKEKLADRLLPKPFCADLGKLGTSCVYCS